MAGKPRDRIWTDAIRKALKEWEEEKQPDGSVKNVRRINLLAKSLVAQGMKGNVPAIQEIGNRLEGKAAQVIEGEVDGTISIEIVRYKDAKTIEGQVVQDNQALSPPDDEPMTISQPDTTQDTHDS